LGRSANAPRDPDPLLLPAGEFRRVAAGVGVPQAHGFEELGNPIAGVGLAEPVGVQRLCQQFENR